MWHLGSFRMHEPVLRELAARGHHIHLALGRHEALGWRGALDTLVADHPTITWEWLSPPTAAFWAEMAKTLRLWVDYLRYFHPDYDRTPILSERAGERLPARLKALSHHPLCNTPARRARLVRVLRWLERALPPVPEIEEAIRRYRPDLVMVTPLIYLGSSQFEVIRAALAQGVRTLYAVGSWDHLSSKALIRDMPQRVFVWNETQKDEAVRLHGVEPERVVVTGAQCYDQWFGRRPVRTRDEFCRRVGLPSDRPFVLYVCSALFWGSPVEAEFVRRWVASLRASTIPAVRDLAVLVRPHPARMDEWEKVDLSGFAHVSLYGSNPVDDASKDDYFESLYYSSAVAGLNTSAFLEGAVVGRPVHTVLLPEFHQNQEGVLHFNYLLTVAGGVLQAGRSFEEHHALLAKSLAEPGAGVGQAFVRAFIRPAGLDVAATPVFCEAVEAQLAAPAPSAQPHPFRFVVLRWAITPALHLLRRVYGAEVFRDDWSRKQKEKDERIEARERVRAERRGAAERRAHEQAARRAAVQAQREAVLREREATRARQEAEKLNAKQARVRAKEAHVRQKRRAQLRAGLMRRASSLLRRVGLGGRGEQPT
jgi:hypothetical protein